MLKEAVDKWKCKSDVFGCEMDENIFSVFFDEHFFGKTVREILSDYGYQLYELQVCIDGLIEDMEYLNGQEDQAA